MIAGGGIRGTAQSDAEGIIMGFEEPEPKEEIDRTQPSFVIYRSSGTDTPDAENQHLHVVVLPSGRMLATWTMATHENHPDQRIVYATSDDSGISWSAPKVLDGAQPGDPPDTGLASWSFPVVVPDTGRVIIGCNKNAGVTDAREDTTGVMRVRVSDDNAETWSDPVDIPFARSPIDSPDLDVPPNWILANPVLLDHDGIPFAGFTRWGGGQGPALFEIDSVINFFRFTNWLTEPDPHQFTVETIMPHGVGLRVPREDHRPEISVAQEPAVVLLPDRGMFCTMRTLNGYVAWSHSHDNGRTWSDPEPMHYHDYGEMVKNPIAPCPVHRLKDGRYILFFYNNDGTGYGGRGPTDYLVNRQEMFLAVGVFDGMAEQPIQFGTAHSYMKSKGVPFGPMGRTEVGSYGSMTEHAGARIYWYPDRKHFLLGKILSV